MNLLLTSVFGPYGVDDEYGREGNKMELFHNQVTREQDIFSYRFNHHSFGLQFLARNLETPTTVLDFPTLDRFIEEIKKGYEYVGISFIVPNVKKAARMARLVRELAPQTQIVIGGHGVNIPDIGKWVEHDHLCRGEGVRFLRRLFGEDVERPIEHPVAYSSFNREVMGVPLPQASGVLIPGVGCANKCRFCATSHFFGSYTPYLSTGEEIFAVCQRYEEELGVTDFGVLDENFLKSPQRARELIQLMEARGKYYTFAIFSSAETLRQLGDLDLLVRLGVNFLWLGVESKQEVYEKNRGVDFHQLVADLRRRGVCVLTSAILFLEQHDQTTIWDDINFAVSLAPDYLQFMQLGPIPGTSLHTDYQRKGILCPEVPYEDQHGQDMIWFKHPHFTREESRDFLKRAFRRDYEVNGASFLRAMRTTLWGYRYAKEHTNPHIQARAQGFHNLLKQMRHFTLAARLFRRNRRTADLARELAREFRQLFGRWDPLALGAVALAAKAKVQRWTRTDTRQPGTLYLQPRSATAPRRPSTTSARPYPLRNQGAAPA